MKEPKKEKKKRSRSKAEEKLKALTEKLLADGLITKQMAVKSWQSRSI